MKRNHGYLILWGKLVGLLGSHGKPCLEESDLFFCESKIAG